MQIKKTHISKESLSDSQPDSQECDQIYMKKPHIDRVISYQPDYTSIIANLAFSNYGVVFDVMKSLGFELSQQKNNGVWDICWTDIPIHTDTLIRMHFHQKINYIPGMEHLARKNLLGYNLNAMKRIHPGQYNFFPNTWMLPQMYSQLRRYMLLNKRKHDFYIVKPQNACQGKGIFLTNRIQDLENGRHYVIQQYLENPYLIDGLKFDLRLYVLIGSTEPLTIYLFNEGLARFATQKYHIPQKKNLHSTFTHLTNYSINKKNPKFIFNKSVQNMQTGHKRSLTSVYKLMEKMGVNISLLKDKIKDVIIKTILTGAPLLSHKYRHSQPQQYNGTMCFHILGLDILLDNDVNPLILQINHLPSFSTDTPLDRKIKQSVIRDTLLLMNINLQTKKNLFEKSKRYNDLRIDTGKRQTLNVQLRQIQLQKAQSAREQYQNQHMGGYQLIYPVKDYYLRQKYQLLLQSSNQIFQNEKNDKKISLNKKKSIHAKIFTSTQKIIQKPPLFPISNKFVMKFKTGCNFSSINHKQRTYKKLTKNQSFFKPAKTIQNKSSIIGSKKRQGSYITAKLFDPLSCQLKKDSFVYNDHTFDLY